MKFLKYNYRIKSQFKLIFKLSNTFFNYIYTQHFSQSKRNTSNYNVMCSPTIILVYNSYYNIFELLSININKIFNLFYMQNNVKIYDILLLSDVKNKHIIN